MLFLNQAYKIGLAYCNTSAGNVKAVTTCYDALTNDPLMLWTYNLSPMSAAQG